MVLVALVQYFEGQGNQLARMDKFNRVARLQPRDELHVADDRQRVVEAQQQRLAVGERRENFDFAFDDEVHVLEHVAFGAQQLAFFRLVQMHFADGGSVEQLVQTTVFDKSVEHSSIVYFLHGNPPRKKDGADGIFYSKRLGGEKKGHMSCWLKVWPCRRSLCQRVAGISRFVPELYG